MCPFYPEIKPTKGHTHVFNLPAEISLANEDLTRHSGRVGLLPQAAICPSSPFISAKVHLLTPTTKAASRLIPSLQEEVFQPNHGCIFLLPSMLADSIIKW